ncbi:MAG: killer suppression protein [Planctomycetaceae bacterium]|nr:killer suppression protein [Planctomycetaceae bacterium]
MANKIQIRLFSLSVADTLEQMRGVLGRCHELTGDLSGCLALDLVHPMRLVFFPNHDPVPRSESGALVWVQVTRVTILDIRDYH